MSALRKPPPNLRLSIQSTRRSLSPPTHIVCTPQISDIGGGIFLGSVGAALDSENLRALRITYVLNMASDCDYTLPGDSPVTHYMRFHLRDIQEAPLASCIHESLRFIQEGIDEGTNVLVHCRKGLSRSAAIVVAYFMWKLKGETPALEGDYLFNAAYDIVSDKRSISINLGFALTLEQFPMTSFPDLPSDTVIDVTHENKIFVP